MLRCQLKGYFLLLGRKLLKWLEYNLKILEMRCLGWIIINKNDMLSNCCQSNLDCLYNFFKEQLFICWNELSIIYCFLSYHHSSIYRLWVATLFLCKDFTWKMRHSKWNFLSKRLVDYFAKWGFSSIALPPKLYSFDLLQPQTCTLWEWKTI